MDQHGVGYSSTGLVAQMRENNNLWKQGEVTVKLAKAYGYCWGVERAVRMAYEARNAFPDKKVYITNEIIHNPEVNQVRAQKHLLTHAAVCALAFFSADAGVLFLALSPSAHPTPPLPSAPTTATTRRDDDSACAS